MFVSDPKETSQKSGANIRPYAKPMGMDVQRSVRVVSHLYERLVVYYTYVVP